MKKLRNPGKSFESRNPVTAVIFQAVDALSGHLANGPQHFLSAMRLTALSVLLLLLPAVLATRPGVARGQGCTVPNVVGKYTLTGEPSGLLVIHSQSGNHVSGRYGKDENSMVNNIEGDFSTGDQCNVLSGTFENTQYNTKGTFKYTFSGNGDSFSGSWRDNKGYTGSWSGTRHGAGVQQEHCPLAASLKNCKQPLELRPGAPSEVCEICISGWCRNTANPVRVILPQQSDWWGTNAPGIVVFAGGREDSPEVIGPMTVEPSNMSGYRCWDSPFETYPWNLFVRARATAPAGDFAIPIEVRQRIPGTDRDAVVNLTMRVRVLPGGRTLTPPGTQTPPDSRAPLKLFWNAARGDNFTTATPEGESAARAAGYTFVRIEGYIYPIQQPGTVPLKLYYNNARGDNYTTASAKGEQAAKAASYGYARVEGYIYPTQQPGTVPLKNYWNVSREDNFTTATSDGERDALGSGYQFAWVEGYVLPNNSSTGGTMGGKYAIQTVNGYYMNATNGGGVFGAGAIHTDATKIDAWETFNLIPLGDGKYAIQTINGNYLTALSGGGIGGGQVTIHTDATKIDAWEKFKLIKLRE
jgi:hypothetical protein